MIYQAELGTPVNQLHWSQLAKLSPLWLLKTDGYDDLKFQRKLPFIIVTAGSELGVSWECSGRGRAPGDQLTSDQAINPQYRISCSM